MGLLVNTISTLSVKELPEEECSETESLAKTEPAETYRLKYAAKLLLSNKYYLIICGIYILTQIFTATLNMGVFFTTYILGDGSLLGAFSMAINIPLIIGLLFTPVLVKKMGGMYQINLAEYCSFRNSQSYGNRRGISGQSANDADFFRHCIPWNEPTAGRFECIDCLLFGIHIFKGSQAH